VSRERSVESLYGRSKNAGRKRKRSLPPRPRNDRRGEPLRSRRRPRPSRAGAGSCGGSARRRGRSARVPESGGTREARLHGPGRGQGRGSAEADVEPRAAAVRGDRPSGEGDDEPRRRRERSLARSDRRSRIRARAWRVRSQSFRSARAGRPAATPAWGGGQAAAGKRLLRPDGSGLAGRRPAREAWRRGLPGSRALQHAEKPPRRRVREIRTHARNGGPTARRSPAAIGER